MATTASDIRRRLRGEKRKKGSAALRTGGVAAPRIGTAVRGTDTPALGTGAGQTAISTAVLGGRDANQANQAGQGNQGTAPAEDASGTGAVIQQSELPSAQEATRQLQTAQARGIVPDPRGTTGSQRLGRTQFGGEQDATSLEGRAASAQGIGLVGDGRSTSQVVAGINSQIQAIRSQRNALRAARGERAVGELATGPVLAVGGEGGIESRGPTISSQKRNLRAAADRGEITQQEAIKGIQDIDNRLEKARLGAEELRSERNIAELTTGQRAGQARLEAQTAAQELAQGRSEFQQSQQLADRRLGFDIEKTRLGNVRQDTEAATDILSSLDLTNRQKAASLRNLGFSQEEVLSFLGNE